ncbi:hypothetical protein [Variovorax guangxiensis]|uniref:hypothetical protein n=1 Tax=Variovorax guangxiensis TaxID=1775474 RepID=UPI0028595C1A|nr:hypothetical protein [Variovorax guangxiensis]MDR6855625.1 hypothetical protein [Variovorax guangxiensis]
MRSRQLTDFIEGFGPVRPFQGRMQPPAQVTRAGTRVCPAVAGRDKMLRDIEAAFDACNIGHGAVAR